MFKSFCKFVKYIFRRLIEYIEALIKSAKMCYIMNRNIYNLNTVLKKLILIKVILDDWCLIHTHKCQIEKFLD